MTDRSIDTIDTLVLDWIVRSGHISTFAKLPTSAAYLDEAERKSFVFRAEVSKSIKAGRILEAIEMIGGINLYHEKNEIEIGSFKLTSTRTLELSHCPPLNLNQILFLLHLQHFIELIRQKNTTAALSFVQTALIPSASPELEQILQEVLGVLVYTDPESSPLAWLFEQPKRYSALASLTNSSLFHLHLRFQQPRVSPLETFLKHVRVFDELVQEIGGIGNELDDRKWAVVRDLLDGAGSGFIKTVKTD